MNKIYQRINSINLTKYEIELTVVDDLKNSITKVSSLKADVNTMNSNAIKTSKLFQDALNQKEILLKNYNDNRKSQENILKELNTLFKTINNQARDLGININDLPVYKEYLSARELLSELGNKTQSSWELVSKY